MSSISQTDRTVRPVAAVLTVGLRPFFLLGAIWAASAMVLWIAALAGRLELPSRFDPVSWHAHAFLFGYLGAIVAGFLLTAVPNWTGRPALTGLPLLGLVLLWVAGRAAVATSAFLPVMPVVVLDLSFPVVLGALLLRDIVAGRNWRNLIIVGLLAAFAIANLIFHIEAVHGEYAAQGVGVRLGLATAVMMMTVIGGRVVPTFTRNWFTSTSRDIHPASPMQSFDKIVLVLTALTLGGWIAGPEWMLTGAALIVLAGVHMARLSRWKGQYTISEPLVFVLHAGYAFIPLGALALGIGVLWPDHLGQAPAQHIWMAGAIGLMTLAMMTRASLGHTGRDLHAGLGTALIYGSLVVSVAARLSAGLWPVQASLFYQVSGVSWVIAFGGFAVFYGGLLVRPRTQST